MKTEGRTSRCARFRARHGSIVCRELLGCDLTSSEGTAHFKENNLLTTVCAVVVRDAAGERGGARTERESKEPREETRP